jgi:uncharacterized BrkB/YihY/UPF0761 family membrane protein
MYRRNPNVEPPMSGNSRIKILDIFVIIHATVAFVFASAMLVYPSFFKLFVVEPSQFNAVAEDAIRWACPFVYGFSGLAVLSLYMPPKNRRHIAILFACSFLLASCIGTWVQTNGRWNNYHPFNIALFGFLFIAYSMVAVCVPVVSSTGKDTYSSE